MTDHPNRSAGSEHPQISFLREAANYFRNRPTHGEDRAFWSNVANADNCEKAANLIERMLDAAQSVGMREALEPFAKYEMIAVGYNGCFSKEDLRDCTWVAGFKGPQPEFGHFKAARAALAASQPSPAATVEKSAPGFSTSQDCCPEREPSSDAAPPGADTSEYRWPGDNKTQSERQQCSAGTAGEPVAWRWNTIGDQAWRVTINRPVPTNLTAFDKIEPLYATQPQTAPLTEFRKLQDIIDSQADRILDLESMVNELHHALTSPMTRPQSGSGL